MPDCSQLIITQNYENHLVRILCEKIEINNIYQEINFLQLPAVTASSLNDIPAGTY